MSEQTMEQRKSPRIDFSLDVRIKGEDGLKQVTNFALYGVFIRLEAPDRFHRGDLMYVDMTFPHENRPLNLEGQVAHVSENGVGVEFVDPPPQDAMSMESCFRIFQHSTPMPGA